MNSIVCDKAKYVAEAMFRIGCFRFEEEKTYTWASGILSPIYCDSRRVNSMVTTRNMVVEQLAVMIKNNCKQVDIIAGVATGGIAIGALVAHQLQKPFIYVRPTAKSHGLKKRIEGFYAKNEKVVVIEDIVSTGKSVAEAIQSVHLAGLEINLMLSIVNYEFDFTREKLKKFDFPSGYLCGMSDIVTVAEDNNNLSTAQKTLIKKFLDDPINWKAN